MQLGDMEVEKQRYGVVPKIKKIICYEIYFTVEILAKNRNLRQNQNLRQKSKFTPNIKTFLNNLFIEGPVGNRNFSQKSKLWPKIQI